MEFIPLVQMAVLVFAIINFLKAVRVADVNAALTQVIVWAAGVLVVFLASQTDFASGIAIGDQRLDMLNGWSLLFVGLTTASLASFSYDIKRAIDRTDSARTPNLIMDTKDVNHVVVIEETTFESAPTTSTYKL